MLKSTPEHSEGFRLYKNYTSCDHNCYKRGSYRKHPYCKCYTPRNNQSYSSNRGNSNYRVKKSHFGLHRRCRGHGFPSMQRLSSLKWFTSRWPHFFQERLAKRKLLKQCVEHYYRLLHPSIHQQPKLAPDHPNIQKSSKGSSPGLLYPVSTDKEHNRKSRKSKNKESNRKCRNSKVS